MAGPGDEIASGAAGRGHLRAARTDRERVIGVLKTAFVQGMLDKDELGQRVGRTLASRTYAELTAVTADLPTLLVPALPPRAPAPARAPMSKPAEAAIFGAATAILAASVFMGPAMVLQVLVFYLLGAFVAVAEILSARHDKRGRRQSMP